MRLSPHRGGWRLGAGARSLVRCLGLRCETTRRDERRCVRGPHQELSGSGGVAVGHECGSRCLPSDSGTTQVRGFWPGFPDASSGGIHPEQHSGRACKNDRAFFAVSFCCPRFHGRIGDPADADCRSVPENAPASRTDLRKTRDDGPQDAITHAFSWTPRLIGVSPAPRPQSPAPGWQMAPHAFACALPTRHSAPPRDR